MSSISLQSTNHSSVYITKMTDNKLIMMITLSYLTVSFIIHILFFITTIFKNEWKIVKISRDLFHRYFKRTQTNKLSSVNTPSFNTEQSCSDIIIQPETLKSLITNKIPSVSSLSSNLILESETILFRTIRSFGLFLCTFLLITNWLRLGIYFFPKFYPNIIQYPSKLCIIQSFFLHVLTLFHLNVTITIRLFWHYCFIFSKYWQKLTYRRIFLFFLCIFIYLCFFTWPSLSDEWGSIIFDRILNICIVNYTFHLSYTFFVLTFTCLIPFILLIVSHERQLKGIKRRILKYFSTFTIEQHKQKLNIIQRQKQFQYASYVILIWSIFNIILLVGIHIPTEHIRIKSMIYYLQLFAFLFDPILYILVFRSLSIITLLRPTNELYF